jgi:hypothetical protein
MARTDPVVIMGVWPSSLQPTRRRPSPTRCARRSSNGYATATVLPIELSKEMNQPLPNVSSHVRELHKLGALALVRERQVRGAVEHTYTAAVRISLKQEPL